MVRVTWYCIAGLAIRFGGWEYLPLQVNALYKITITSCLHQLYLIICITIDLVSFILIYKKSWDARVVCIKRENVFSNFFEVSGPRWKTSHINLFCWTNKCDKINYKKYQPIIYPFNLFYKHTFFTKKYDNFRTKTFKHEIKKKCLKIRNISAPT